MSNRHWVLRKFYKNMNILALTAKFQLGFEPRQLKLTWFSWFAPDYCLLKLSDEKLMNKKQYHWYYQSQIRLFPNFKGFLSSHEMIFYSFSSVNRHSPVSSTVSKKSQSLVNFHTSNVFIRDHKTSLKCDIKNVIIIK